ncbi:MAG: hypothetical protein ACOY9Y_10135 [Bacillota bacterium]
MPMKDMLNKKLPTKKGFSWSHRWTKRYRPILKIKRLIMPKWELKSAIESFIPRGINQRYTWGNNREQAIDRMEKARGEFRIEGVKTTLKGKA